MERRWSSVLPGLTPSGRTNRTAWWLTCIFIILLLCCYSAVGLLVGTVVMPPFSEAELGLSYLLKLLYLAGAFAVIILSVWMLVIAGARRLHDLGRNDSWIALLIGVPFLLSGIRVAGMPRPVFAGLDVGDMMSIGIVIAMTVWLGLIKGTPGPNQYGAEPGS